MVCIWGGEVDGGIYKIFLKRLVYYLYEKVIFGGWIRRAFRNLRVFLIYFDGFDFLRDED